MGFQIGFKDIIDIVLVAILLSQSYKLVKKSGGASIFIGIMLFLLLWFIVSYVFPMELLGRIFDTVVNVGAFALVVLFQDEIKRFFSKLGSTKKWNVWQSIKGAFSNSKTDNEARSNEILQIVRACKYLSKSSTGGLIVIGRRSNLEYYYQSGEQINAIINARLIENIFFKNSPLHDGAMIISKGKIKAAACILPVSKNQSIPKRLGLRHRAALGITELTDSIAIIISEESGQVSWSVNGELTLQVKLDELDQFLTQHCENLNHL